MNVYSQQLRAKSKRAFYYGARGRMARSKKFQSESNFSPVTTLIPFSNHSLFAVCPVHTGGRDKHSGQICLIDPVLLDE